MFKDFILLTQVITLEVTISLAIGLIIMIIGVEILLMFTLAQILSGEAMSGD